MGPEQNIGSASRFEQLQRFARNTLAVAGASLAMLGAGAEKSSAASDIVPPILAPQPVATPLPVETTPTVGVATSSWNADGSGYHTLFKDVAAEGMSEIRLNLTAPRDMRAEFISARNNNLDPIICLPLSLKPQQAAAVAADLPRVDHFIIGNEVNSPYFSDLTPAEYVSYLAHTTAAIHQLRPDAQTGGFALASGFQPLQYLEAATQIADEDYGGLANIENYLDVHLYRSLDEDLSRVKEFEQIYSGPIRIGETGWMVNDPGHPGVVTQTEQATNESTLITTLSLDPQIVGIDFFRYRANRTDPFDTANVSATGVRRLAWFSTQLTLTGNINPDSAS